MLNNLEPVQKIAKLHKMYKKILPPGFLPTSFSKKTFQLFKEMQEVSELILIRNLEVASKFAKVNSILIHFLILPVIVANDEG
jgi:hypothetical protein